MKCGIEQGNVVKSMAGRDKNNIFVVMDFDKEYVYLADGDIRKVENPKKKKIKHVELTNYFDESLTEKIKNKKKITNHELRKFLKEL